MPTTPPKRAKKLPLQRSRKRRRCTELTAPSVIQPFQISSLFALNMLRADLTNILRAVATADRGHSNTCIVRYTDNSDHEISLAQLSKFQPKTIASIDLIFSQQRMARKDNIDVLHTALDHICQWKIVSAAIQKYPIECKIGPCRSYDINHRIAQQQSTEARAVVTTTPSELFMITKTNFVFASMSMHDTQADVVKCLNECNK